MTSLTQVEVLNICHVKREVNDIVVPHSSVLSSYSRRFLTLVYVQASEVTPERS
jgi:hypothetical protein